MSTRKAPSRVRRATIRVESPRAIYFYLVWWMRHWWDVMDQAPTRLTPPEHSGGAESVGSLLTDLGELLD